MLGTYVDIHSSPAHGRHLSSVMASESSSTQNPGSSVRLARIESILPLDCMERGEVLQRNQKEEDGNTG